MPITGTSPIFLSMLYRQAMDALYFAISFQQMICPAYQETQITIGLVNVVFTLINLQVTMMQPGKDAKVHSVAKERCMNQETLKKVSKLPWKVLVNSLRVYGG